MTLIELKRLVDSLLENKHENLDVVVSTEDSSIGPSACSEVVGMFEGFDWESGRLNIVCKDRLIKESSLSQYGILTGKDAERFHEKMEKNENHIKTEEEIKNIERIKKMCKLILEKSKK
jgi:hypothetical protein